MKTPFGYNGFTSAIILLLASNIASCVHKLAYIVQIRSYIDSIKQLLHV